MAYSAQVSTAKPTCFLFLVDQSPSMKDALGSVETRSANLDQQGAGLRRFNVALDEVERGDPVHSSPEAPNPADNFLTASDLFASGGPARRGPISTQAWFPI